ncbi:pleckstrin domain-containing protein [Stylonychia lemnae]|uniref:Pleckstrin domain-containing protein n=1 Tax=Stylonychia lemnae TaxID=5949 RepID=A0A078AVX8_STYLE|nr:pleckstrin domain-containing protein [Stylonychia lemnae]|eukprot:CDW86610.1 pleckstrin domain-containing protein [Stylonychia lemnae]
MTNDEIKDARDTQVGQGIKQIEEIYSQDFQRQDSQHNDFSFNTFGEKPIVSYQNLNEINLQLRIDFMETEMKHLIFKNNELTQIARYYQSNIQRLNSEVIAYFSGSNVSTSDRLQENDDVIAQKQRADTQSSQTKNNIEGSDSETFTNVVDYQSKIKITINKVMDIHSRNLGQIDEEDPMQSNFNSEVQNTVIESQRIANISRPQNHVEIQQDYHKQQVQILESKITQMMSIIQTDLMGQSSVASQSILNHQHALMGVSVASRDNLLGETHTDIMTTDAYDKSESKRFDKSYLSKAISVQEEFQLQNINAKQSQLVQKQKSEQIISGILNRNKGARSFVQKQKTQLLKSSNADSHSEYISANRRNHSTTRSQDRWQVFNHATAGNLREQSVDSYLDEPLQGIEPTKWTPNERFNNCQVCSNQFGIFKRKHHCRSCGQLVCAGCSPNKDYVFGYKDIKVRVCQQCLSKKKKRVRLQLKKRVFTSANSSLANQPRYRKR